MANNAAFDILYREYYVRVFGLCRRLLNDPDLVEDAVQESFMKAYRNFRKYRPETPFWQWIAAIANHHCIDILRQRNRHAVRFDEDEELPDNDDLTDTVISDLISVQDAESLNAAVAQLPDKYRIPLVLAYFNQSTYDEIAQQLDVTRNHVGVLILRAKQQLRKSLNRQSEPSA